MLLLKSFTSDDRSIVPLSARVPTSADKLPLLSLRIRVYHPNTRIYVRLLGPCFKTGRWKPFRQNRDACICRLTQYQTHSSIALLSHTNWHSRSKEPSQKAQHYVPQSNPQYRLQVYNSCPKQPYLPHCFLPRIELILTTHSHRTATIRPSTQSGLTHQLQHLRSGQSI